MRSGSAPKTDAGIEMPAKDPVASIIVPVFDQWPLAQKLLASIEMQSFPKSAMEVILVDNGSTDYAPPAELPPYVRILHCEQPGSYAARNLGAAAANGSWLVFTDADCTPEPHWVGALVDALQSGSELVAGPVRVRGEAAQPNAFEVYDTVRGIPQAWYVSRGYAATANLAVSRRLFDALQGFDARRLSGGDADFCLRSAASGVRVRLAREAVVNHPARSTWLELVTKARRMKGGQLRHQRNLLRTALAYCRTFFPPVVAIVRFLGASEWPLRYRAVAIGVVLRLWFVEMAEALRIAFGGELERR